MSSRPDRFTRPRMTLQSLEDRAVPTTGLNFDFDADASFPDAEWDQFSTDAPTAFDTTDMYASSPTRSLTVGGGRSDARAWAWVEETQPADTSVSADVFLNSLIPAQVIARGSGLDAEATASFYALSIDRGETGQGPRVKLQHIDGITVTDIAELNSTADYISGTWVRLTLQAEGSNLTAQVRRLDDGQYLGGDGQWHGPAVNAIEVIDTSIAGGGHVGVARPASYAGQVFFDNVGLRSVAPATVETFDGDGVTVNAAPVGWTTWTDNDTEGFTVTDEEAFSGVNSLVFESAIPRPTRALAWHDTFSAADATVTADIKLTNMDFAQVMVRGQGIDSDEPSYYAAKLTRGFVDLEIVKVIDGGAAVGISGTARSDEYLSSDMDIWARVTLEAEGEALRAKLQRSDTKEFLQNDGSWSLAETWVVSATDGDIGGAGGAGVGRDVTNANPINYDNVTLGALLTTAGHDDFDGSSLTGWTEVTDGDPGVFTVSNEVPAQSAPQALVAEPGIPRQSSARLWRDDVAASDASVSADVYLEGLDDIEIMARGIDIESDSPSYYAARFTRGYLNLRLVKVTGDTEEVLTSVSSQEYITSTAPAWVRVTLEVHGGEIRASIKRLEDGLFLQSDGTWAAGDPWAVAATDSDPLAGNRVGLGRAITHAGFVVIDNFMACEI